MGWVEYYYTKREKLDEAENLALRAIELNPLKDKIYRDTLEKVREMRTFL